jgi:hypothetical protein
VSKGTQPAGDEIRRGSPAEGEEDEIDEVWERVPPEVLRGVTSTRWRERGNWQVTLLAMEYIGYEDPFELEYRRRVASALQAVDGVASVNDQARESWWVTGTPSGRTLILAAARVADELYDRALEFLGGDPGAVE